MSNLATITNNILADSGIDDINVVVTTGSYANPAWITSLAWNKITGAPLGDYLPLVGGTMTGNINWAQTDRGLTWVFNTDGASIKFYNTGDGDTDSRLEFATLDNNDEYFRWGHIPSGGPFYESMRLKPVSNGNAELIVTGKIIKAGGTSSQYLMADGSVSTLSNPITGTGTPNTLPRFTASTTIGDSAVTDNGTTIVLGRATSTLAAATEANSITITQPSFTTDQPVKLLNFNWYDEPWSIGNIRSSSSPSNGLGVFATGVEKVRFKTDALLLQNINLQFRDNPSIRWSSNFLNLKNTDSSIPVIALRANGSNNQAPRLDMYNAADDTVTISLNGISGTGAFNSSLTAVDYRFNTDGYITYDVINSGTATFQIRKFGTNVLSFNSSNQASFVSNVIVSGKLGVATGTPRTRAEFVSGLPTAIPTFTDTTNGIAVTDGGAIYGRIGVSNFSGIGAGYPTYIQGGDYTAAIYYNLLLNPLGANVGIGTTNPIATLDVNSSVRLAKLGSGIVFTSTNTGQAWMGSENWGWTGSAWSRTSSSAGVIWGTGNNSGAFEVWTTTTSDAASTAPTNSNSRLIVTNSGSLGIGTVSPSQRIHIDGQQGQPATSGTTQNGILRIQGGGGVGYGETLDMGFHVGVSGPASYGWIQSTNTSNLAINYRLSLNPNGGAVLVGTTTDNGSRFRVGGTIWADFTITYSVGFSSYTVDGLFSANARYGAIFTPSGADRIRFGYYDQGGGQYWGRIGFQGNTNWSLGTGAGGHSFVIGVDNGGGGNLVIDNAGAATFSSSVTTNGNVNVQNGSVYAGLGGPAADRGFYAGSSGFQASFLYNNTTGNLDISPRAGYNTIFTGGDVTTNGTLFVLSNKNASARFYGEVGFDGGNRFYITNNAYIYGRNNLILTGRLDAGNDGYSFGSNGRNSLVFNSNDGGAQGSTGTEYMSIQLQLVTKALYIQTKDNSDNGRVGTTFFQSGNVSFGSTSDTGYKFYVNGTGKFESNLAVGGVDIFSGANLSVNSIVRIGNAFGTAAAIILGDAGTPYWSISRPASSGNFSISSYAINNIIQLAPTTGVATFSSSVTATAFFESSDKRLKSNIINLDIDASSIIAKHYTKNGIEEIGYLAQDVETILPSAISKRDDGYLDLSYRQVHTAKIAYLEKRINELEQQLKNN